jgi:3'(2'), 5'-bisphosphate nucleotidase
MNASEQPGATVHHPSDPASYRRDPLPDTGMVEAGLLPKLIALAVEAGKAILDIYNLGATDITYKADRSPLTLADRNSHAVITRGLQKLSEFPMLSEEGTFMPFEQRKAWKTFWLIDPLDGTKEFIKRNGEFTVNIALIANGVPVLGIVHCPVVHTLYYGSERDGSFLMENIRFDNLHNLDTLMQKARKLPFATRRKIFTVVASRSHRNQLTDKFIASLRKKYGRIHTAGIGSSLKLCLVAEGSADIYPRLGPTMEWDTAAAHAVVRYAGGSVICQESGLPLRYNKKDLCNPGFIARKRME